MDARGKLGEHERIQRSALVARGEAECFSASRVLSQLAKCIHNLIDAQLNRVQFLLNSIYKKTYTEADNVESSPKPF